MVSISAVQNGIVKYLDAELLPKLTGWKKWTFGAMASLWLGNLNNTFAKIKENAFVKSLGVVDSADMIDIDKIYLEIYKQAQKGAIVVDIPFIEKLTLNISDVELLYRFILEG